MCVHAHVHVCACVYVEVGSRRSDIYQAHFEGH